MNKDIYIKRLKELEKQNEREMLLDKNKRNSVIRSRKRREARNKS